MSRAFGKCPYKIDSKGIALCSRPRLYWVSWRPSEGVGVEFQEGVETGWQAFTTVSLKAEVDAGAFLEKGWSLREGCNLPTFTTSRPRTSPGRRPAGIDSCQAHELQRWSSHSYRFPPYQYKDTHGLWNRKGQWRRPGVQEREVIMGFPLGYTRNCVVKAEQQGETYEDTRLTLLGNSWQVGVVAWLILQLMFPLGLCKPWSLQTLVNQFIPGWGQSFYHVLLRPPFPCRQHSPPGLETVALVRRLLGMSTSKGEDLLVHAGSDPLPRHCRLRASIPGRLWRWKEISGWTWKHPGDHINLLELRAILTTVRWKILRGRRLRVRFLHLTDSLVCLHALTRGRSSSRKLRRTIQRLNAYLLAADLHPLWGYIHTSQNPADRPSRRPIRRKWAK